MNKYYSWITHVVFAILPCCVIAQTQQDYLCGNFSHGNGFEILDIHIKCDSTFEWNEFHDLGGWLPSTRGRWRSSGDTIFLTTLIHPKILNVEETTENKDSITITFFDNDGRNITEHVPGLWTLRINGVQQNPDFSFKDSILAYRFLEPRLSHKITFKRTEQNRYINTFNFSFDRIPLSYCVKNPDATSFHIVLDQCTDLWSTPRSFGYGRFFLNEALFYHDNSYHLQQDHHCFNSPIADSGNFNLNYPLNRY
jgi:hypothetical protein